MPALLARTDIERRRAWLPGDRFDPRPAFLYALFAALPRSRADDSAPRSSPPGPVDLRPPPAARCWPRRSTAAAIALPTARRASIRVGRKLRAGESAEAPVNPLPPRAANAQAEAVISMPAMPRRTAAWSAGSRPADRRRRRSASRSTCPTSWNGSLPAVRRRRLQRRADHRPGAAAFGAHRPPRPLDARLRHRTAPTPGHARTRPACRCRRSR